MSAADRHDAIPPLIRAAAESLNAPLRKAA